VSFRLSKDLIDLAATLRRQVLRFPVARALYKNTSFVTTNNTPNLNDEDRCCVRNARNNDLRASDMPTNNPLAAVVR
jgi:hypothetical protein